ncbi:acyl-CoA-binding protein [Deinococcus irradiatisoli]|uniref:Acyl-CoA-binding protein n=1 Tax=Deinococcus irradiatisoli TaxID=2202254 RepID=A0A2Z3JIW1_9DEIO|nr:acyl-CoA-binding protein [Deinococcus irradiatisoli]AWN23541.1 acyl-CoA-binding protein [Deinococcus irradiatisoli]
MSLSFEQARAESQNLPKKPDNATLLRLYALYKQGSQGDVTGERPGGFDFVGGAKYDAWAALKGKPQADAQAEYAALVEQLQQG